MWLQVNEVGVNRIDSPSRNAANLLLDILREKKGKYRSFFDNIDKSLNLTTPQGYSTFQCLFIYFNFLLLPRNEEEVFLKFLKSEYLTLTAVEDRLLRLLKQLPPDDIIRVQEEL